MPWSHLQCQWWIYNDISNCLFTPHIHSSHDSITFLPCTALSLVSLFILLCMYKVDFCCSNINFVYVYYVIVNSAVLYTTCHLVLTPYRSAYLKINREFVVTIIKPLTFLSQKPQLYRGLVLSLVPEPPNHVKWVKLYTLLTQSLPMEPKWDMKCNSWFMYTMFCILPFTSLVLVIIRSWFKS